MSNYQARRIGLIQVLAVKPQDAMLHLTVDQLDDYVQAQVAGERYTALFPETARHLDSCVACAEIYHLLYELILAEAAAVLPAPASIPEPDLTFLRSAPIPSLWQQIRAAVQQIEQQISLQLTPSLVLALRPANAMSTLRSAMEGQRYGEKLIHLDPPQALLNEWSVTLIVYRDIQYADLCLVEVVVAPPGYQWPNLAGILVTLTVNRSPRTGFTDAWGMVVFELVPITWLGEMKITVDGL